MVKTKESFTRASQENRFGSIGFSTMSPSTAARNTTNFTGICRSSLYRDVEAQSKYNGLNRTAYIASNLFAVSSIILERTRSVRDGNMQTNECENLRDNDWEKEEA